ncbi:hypothetical protein CE91St68_08010 [Methanobrevibacter smithii]|nr:hypothetical protein CE91St68_08010 [Methanobrevibacter smithii]
MKTATGKNQPKYSHFFEMLLTAFGKEDLKLYPTPYSKIKKGIPIIKIATIYGMKNAPPPLLYKT